MTNLDALLEDLEALDKKRTPGAIVKGKKPVSVNDFYMGIGMLYNFGTLRSDDADFIAAAVNTNAKLREIIRVQREALDHLHKEIRGSGLELYIDQIAIAVEKLAGEEA